MSKYNKETVLQAVKNWTAGYVGPCKLRNIIEYTDISDLSDVLCTHYEELNLTKRWKHLPSQRFKPIGMHNTLVRSTTFGTYDESGKFTTEAGTTRHIDFEYCVPLYRSYLEEAKQKVDKNFDRIHYPSHVDIVDDEYTISTNPIKQEETKMKNITNDAKSSLKLATDLAKGRVALSTVHSLVTKVLPVKFSWFARLTGKDKKIMDSPYTKLAGAAVAHAIAQQFDNDLVKTTTKLAQDAALVQLAELIPLEDYIAELTKVAVENKHE